MLSMERGAAMTGETAFPADLSTVRGADWRWIGAFGLIPIPSFSGNDASNVCNGSGFSDATRGRLIDAGRCLASEKRSSGKSRGWAWWAVCCYGDLGCGLALDLI